LTCPRIFPTGCRPGMPILNSKNIPKNIPTGYRPGMPILIAKQDEIGLVRGRVAEHVELQAVVEEGTHHDDSLTRGRCHQSTTCMPRAVRRSMPARGKLRCEDAAAQTDKAQNLNETGAGARAREATRSTHAAAVLEVVAAVQPC
jgi:hypothetical protein